MSRKKSTLLACDYLVIGAGAASLAFIDTLITELPSVKIILVDKNPVPGGHWQHAYDYVHLHQPSVIYGLASKQLEGSWIKLILKLTLPWTHRASKKEIVKYYGDFVKEKIAAKNLIYYPNCVYDFEKGYSFSSLDETFSYEVKVREKVVNGVLGECVVPSQNPVKFPVDDGVIVMTPNELYKAYNDSKLQKWNKKYVVMGGGKTGMDAIVYLLNTMWVKPRNIHWIIPHDGWFLHYGDPWSRERALLRTNGDDEMALELLEKSKQIARLDPNVQPSRYKFPVVGPFLLRTLRKIKKVIRKGRVTALKFHQERIQMHFDESNQYEIFDNDTIFVHCTSPGPFNDVKVKYLFQSEQQLDLYLLFAPPVTISMSMLGYLEAARQSNRLDMKYAEQLYSAIHERNPSDDVTEEKKESLPVNEILKGIVFPFTLEEGTNQKLVSLLNQAIFLAIGDMDPMIPYKWLKSNRLSMLSIPGSKVKSYEQMEKMILNGKELGYSEGFIEMFRLLKTKLEILKEK